MGDVQRVAMVSVHTSPLDPPGSGDAGGLNVYVVETAKRIARRGVQVEIFTRATSGDLPPTVETDPGVTVVNVVAGPFEGLAKADLPAQLCAFTAAVQRAEARHPGGWFDVVHSHYWLSGQVGWLVRERWAVPLVHSAHTLAKVKNAALADGDELEPMARVIGEEQVVAEADVLVAPTDDEAGDLIDLYDADPGRVVTIPPGVDLDAFTPTIDRRLARARLGLPADALVLAFVGRIQPLKAPDLLLRAAAQLRAADHEIGRRLHLVVCGAPSGSGLATPRWLPDLAHALGLEHRVHFLPPVARDGLADVYRAADYTVVPSFNESFGLVALESQACGTPVVAAAVGGLPTAVADGRSGVLVAGHDPRTWADVLGGLLRDPGRRATLAAGARGHAEQFSWDRTTDSLLEAYAGAITHLHDAPAVIA